MLDGSGAKVGCGGVHGAAGVIKAGLGAAQCETYVAGIKTNESGIVTDDGKKLNTGDGEVMRTLGTVTTKIDGTDDGTAVKLTITTDGDPGTVKAETVDGK
jgi:hypothetical protein